jgi:uncharacterized protein YcfL
MKYLTFIVILLALLGCNSTTTGLNLNSGVIVLSDISPYKMLDVFDF